MVQEIISSLLFVQHEDETSVGLRTAELASREAEVGKTSGTRSTGPVQGTEGNLA